jgi:hypothetical protein
MLIDYSHNPLKFPKANEEENIELKEFKQVHVDLYRISHIDDLDIDERDIHTTNVVELRK